MSWLTWCCVLGCPRFPEPLLPDPDEDTATSTAALDRDGDGVADGEDCAPDDATVYPGADEVVGNGIDEDCDGLTPFGEHAIGAVSVASVMGSFVPAAGDFDGDGTPDLGLAIEGNTNGWRARSFDGTGFAQFATGTLDAKSDPFAWVTAAGVPDLDGDGADELVIASANGAANASVHLLFDVAGSTETRVWIANQVDAAIDVVAVPDVDGDKVPDVWVGDWGGRQFGVAGAHLLVSGAEGPSKAPLGLEADAYASAWLPEVGASWGGSVAGGDLDGDGRAELLLGTAGDPGPADGQPHADPMMVAIYDSTLTGRSQGALEEQTALLTLITGLDRDDSVWKDDTAVVADADVGDVDGDGCNDVVTGMAFDAAHQGSVQLLYGCRSGWLARYGPDEVDARVVGVSPQEGFGRALAVVPDYFDGEAAVAVADPSHDSGRGRVYVLAASKLAGITDLRENTDAVMLELVGGVDQGLGAWLVGAGDMNQDGRGDLLLGEATYNYGDQVFLLLGSTVPSTVTGL